MRTFIKNHKIFFYILLLCFIGGFFRFYNLNWGSPFYFHPDERNIASSIVNLDFPNQMNPHFFAYGSFPIYLIYFTGLFVDFFLKPQNLFIQAIIISRFYSAMFSLLLIPSIYFLGEKLGNKRIGFIAAIFCTFSIGLIQFAHFGTFEIWLTFLGLWFFYSSLNLRKDLTLKNIFAVSVLFGLLMAVKVSSFPLLAIPVIITLLNFFSKIKTKSLSRLIYFFSIASFRVLIFLCISFTIFIFASPYVFLDYSSFIASIKYESSVALGTLPVFYTGEFFHSIPVIFQFTKIYPFLLNPVMTILFVPSLIYIIFTAFKKDNKSYLLLVSCFLLLFLSQALLFAKWTRYIVPTLPFVYLIIAIALTDFLKRKALHIKYLVLSIIIATNIIFAASYLITAFAKQDTRIEASLWAAKNIPKNTKILSEVYDMGIVPFNQYLRNISLFNFYDLDQSPEIKPLELKDALDRSEYIILSSQRILKTRLLNKNKFLLGNNFYKDLFDEKLGFQKIYETNCDIFCKIVYLGNPVFSFEQTTNVFDRPIVFIFKKISNLKLNEN